MYSAYENNQAACHLHLSPSLVAPHLLLSSNYGQTGTNQSSMLKIVSHPEHHNPRIDNGIENILVA
jgi:hypothetical protein